MEEPIKETILRLIRRIAPEADLRTLDPDRRYRDQFNFDSVDFLNLAIGIQEELKIQIPEGDYPKLATLSGAVVYLNAKISSGGK